MDETETLVNRFLVSRGYKNIVYEPDGNVPPDFIVDERVAVEVRRLNQSIEINGKVEGLEELAIPLWKQLRAFFQTFPTPPHANSWHVFYSFRRPISPWRKLRPKIAEILQSFVLSPPADDALDVQVEPGFRMRFSRASKAYPTYFVLGGNTDHESGGFMLAEMEKWIQYYVNEKTKKIKPFRRLYGEWWLIMVDYIGYGLEGLDIDMFQDQVTVLHDWDRLIIVNPRNPTNYFEIASGHRV